MGNPVRATIVTCWTLLSKNVFFLLTGNCICFPMRFWISLLKSPTHFLLNLVWSILPVSEFVSFDFWSGLPEITVQYISFTHGLWQTLQPFWEWMRRSCDLCAPWTCNATLVKVCMPLGRKSRCFLRSSRSLYIHLPQIWALGLWGVKVKAFWLWTKPVCR